ncbi:MAG: response regulator transcription factor [Rhodanobacteraceae bacterium]
MSTDILPIVHVIDDDESMRTALARLLGAAGFDVRTYAGAGDFSLTWRDDGPACILLDVCMPGPSGLDLQRALAQRVDAPPVVFLSGQGDIAMSVGAMKAGAVDFLSKPVERDALLAAVNAAVERDRSRRDLLARNRRILACYASLSARERQVFAHITAGRLHKQIADDLGTCERTIKAHRAHVMEKFQAHSFLELIRIAAELDSVKGMRPVPDARRSDAAACT